MNRIAPKILNIAHRGFSSLYVENSRTAFAKALEVGADGFECDIRMTQDVKLVLFHDDKLKTLCGVRGSIEKSNWNDLKKLKVLHREPICLVEQVLKDFSNCTINFEIKKTKRYKELVDRFFELLQEYKPKAKIYISSFSLDIIRYAHQVYPKSFSIGLSPIFTKPRNPSFSKIKKLKWISSWNIHFTGIRSFQKKMMREKFQQSKAFWLWTLNTKSQWESSLKSGFEIGAIMTDHPDKLHRYLNSLRVKPSCQK